jgi:hypothetical protein
VLDRIAKRLCRCGKIPADAGGVKARAGSTQTKRFERDQRRAGGLERDLQVIGGWF